MLGSLAIGLISIFFPFAGLVILLVILGFVILKKTGLGFAASLFYSWVTTLVIMGSLSFLMDFFAHEYRQFGLISIAIAVVNIFLIYRQHPMPTKAGFSTQVSLPLLMSIIGMAILLIPVINTHSSSELIWFLSSGEDNASHFAMLNRAFTEQGAPYFDSDTGLIHTLNVYPQAIQLFFGYGIWSLIGSTHLDAQYLLGAYYLMMVLVCGGFIFISALLFQSFAASRLRISSIIIGAGMLFITVLLFLAGWGFVSQIMAITLFLALLYLLHHLKEKVIHPVHAILVGTIITGIAFTWYLLLIPALFILLKPALYAIRHRLTKIIVYVSVFGVLSLGPIILNVLNSKGSGALNEPGGVYKYGTFAMTVMIVIALLSILAWWKHGHGKTPNILFRAILGSIALTLMIATYQILTIGHFEYYFYKSLYLTLIVELIFLVALCSHMISFIFTTLSRSKILTANIVVVSLAIASVYIIKPTYPLVYMNNWFNHTLLPTTLEKSIVLYNEQQAADVLLVDCDTTREYIANRWNGALFLSESLSRNKLETSRFYGKAPDSELSNYARTREGTVVIRDSCVK